MENLKRAVILLALLTAIDTTVAHAEVIDADTAQEVAETFLRSRVEPAPAAAPLVLRRDRRATSHLPHLAVFNADNDRGFVIVSLDSAAPPILAYGIEGRFDGADLPAGLATLLEEYEEGVASLTLNATHGEQRLGWSTLLAGDGNAESKAAPIYTEPEPCTEQSPTTTTTKRVGPLIDKKWNQDCGYNEYAPRADGGPCNRAYAGCVAVAMGQIMAFHEFPAKSPGGRSYDWEDMPDTKASDDVALLLSDIGIAVNMDYGASSSGANSGDAEKAFQNAFGYRSTIDYVSASSYGSGWESLIRTEIDQERPVYYAACRDGGCHAFVVHGFDYSYTQSCYGASTSTWFEINWGWSGYYDGYYRLSDLSPGERDYDHNHRAIVGIQP